ncbi:MAG TPA: hypothetical protein VGA21_06355 [Cyclobacteriaceae bacterium]|jgi:hypothetical protein
MSSTKNTSEVEHYHLLAEKCITIVKKFFDPSIPLSTLSFKNMLFCGLHDAYMHRDDSSVNDEHVASMYYLWEILKEIDDLEMESICTRMDL